MHDFTIPIGPQHPALKEPTCLRVTLDGNYIQEIDLRLGYTHKGLEKILEGKNPDSALYISQRICGICSAAHENAYTRTVESILKFNADYKVKLLRVLMMELERIHSHLLWLGLLSHEIGYDTLFMYFWREREKIIDIFEKITGGRVHHNFNKIKTVRYDLKKRDKEFIIKRIKQVENKVKKYLSEIYSDHIIKARLKNIGAISKRITKKFCLVGPNARGSGVRVDIRKIDPPYKVYKELYFKEIIESKGDSFSRTLVRLKEILESIKIIDQVLEKLPDKKIPKFDFSLIKEGEGIGRVEAPRGELFYFLKFKNNKIQRAKIRTPTFAYLKILEHILKGCEIGDIPVVVGSLDPCFSCLERIMIVKDGKEEYLTEKQFRRKYVCTK
ncbi:MAG: nickel-dependent hydrogenase large subunit [Candidatus Aenigmatarchaeota archaeon]